MPLDVLETVILHLEDPDIEAVQILVTQKSLPMSIFESLITLLGKEYNSPKGHGAWKVLSKRVEFFSILPNLTQKFVTPLTRGLVALAFKQDLCCYFRGVILVFDLPERMWEIPMPRPEDRHKFVAALKIAREEISDFVPTESHSPSVQ